MQNKVEQLCKFFMDGFCQQGYSCKYIHDEKACKFYFFQGKCPEKNCEYKHKYTQEQKQNQKKNQQQSNQKDEKQQQKHENDQKQLKSKAQYIVKNDNQDEYGEERKTNQRKNSNQYDNRQQRKRNNSYDDSHGRRKNNNNRNYNNNNRNDYKKNNNKQYNDDDDEYGYGNNNNNRGNKSRPINGNKNNIMRNTESFEPCYDPADMKIRYAIHYPKSHYNRVIEARDIIIVPNIFTQDETDQTIYTNLMSEIKASGQDQKMWKLWHGDNHLIADDKTKWQQGCPTFTKIIDTLQSYFKMKINATRLNWYRDSTEWKPYHHDAAAVKPEIAKKQNFTVSVSFGCERDLAFEHAKTRTVISCPMPNGSVFAFSKDVNVIWRHGIPQLPSSKQHKNGRISIIAWGWVDNMEEA